MARPARLEGKTLSSTGTLENNPLPEAAGTAHDHSHDGENHEHHQHGPVLNPECTRELVIDVPADEVTQAYRRTANNYKKYARIPGFRPGKVPDSVVRRKFAGEIRKEVIDTLRDSRSIFG